MYQNGNLFLSSITHHVVGEIIINDNPIND